MRKTLCVILAAILLLTGTAAAAFAEDTDTAVNTAAVDTETGTGNKLYTGRTRVHFYLRPETDMRAKRTCEVPYGSRFTLIENTNEEWCRIRYGNSEGYVKKAWLIFDEELPIPEGYTMQTAEEEKEEIVPGQDTGGTVYSGKARTDFYLREEPTLTAKRVKFVGNSKEFTMLGNTNDNWCLIRTGSGDEGYAKKEWLKFASEPPKTGDLGMSTPDFGAQYICKAFKPTSVLREPSSDSKQVCWLKRYQRIYCLKYGDEWSEIQTTDGKYTGYVRTSMLFHFQSLNSFLFQVPGYEQWKMTGYVIMKNAVKVSDGTKFYNGNDLCEGDMLTAQKTPDGTVRLQIRHTFADLNPEDYEYFDFTDWRKAKEGDYIGGFTQYFGKHQGGLYYAHRQHNIKLAMTRMNDTVVRKNEEYSFLENVQPGGSTKGYEVAGITGGSGAATGGGICHTSTVMYEAALSVPFLITEREPHTPFGNSYAPLEFDATVGAYSDMRFVNTLPYDIRIEAIYCMESGIINVRFVCMETVDPEILAHWHTYEKTAETPDTAGSESGAAENAAPAESAEDHSEEANETQESEPADMPEEEDREEDGAA